MSSPAWGPRTEGRLALGLRRAAFFLAVLAYSYSLDGLYIPHIGDEAPYIEITRLTAEGGGWLPLRTAPGLENTKPPLLFWIGMIATDFGDAFTLIRLRAPIVLFTFLVAALVFIAARRVADHGVAAVAALSFLGFHTSFQYGRPFLTNMPETFFVFLSFALVWAWPTVRDSTVWMVAVGAALGAACGVNAFALGAPVGLALSWLALMRCRWDVRAFGRREVPRVALVLLVALGCFAVWPLFDPNPSEIFRHFVLEENFGKLGGAGNDGGGYVRGLVRWPYPLYRLWLGPFGNAGLFALPLLFVVVASVQNRRALGEHEKGLWILVLSFLVVFSVPSQRQENYLLPVMPALAILLAMRWRSIDASWFRIFNLPGLVALGLMLYLVPAVSELLPPASYSFWHVAIPVATFAGWLAATAFPAWAPAAFHGLVFATLVSLACALAPFEGPAGRFAPERVSQLAGRRVFVPESFIRRHERHRFLLPGARVDAYDPLDTNAVSRLLESGAIVVVHRAPTDQRTGPFRVLARRLDLTSRHTPAEIWRIAIERDVTLLVRQELVVRRFRPSRERGRSP